MILGLVVLVVYFMKVESTVDPSREKAVVNIYKEMEEKEELYGDLSGATIIKEDTNESNDSCR